MLLSLPAVTPGIPPVIDFGTCGANHLNLALSMSRCGMIADADLAGLASPRLDSPALNGLIEAVWARECDPLFQFKAISACATLVIPGDGTTNVDLIGENKTPQCGVMINASSPESLVIGKTMCALERSQRGLGCTALDLLDGAFSRFCMPFTPRGAFEMAQMLYWQGETDEKSAAEMYEDEGCDPGDIVKRADIFKGIPAWAYDFSASRKRRLDSRGLAQAAERRKNRRYGPLLDALMRLDKLLVPESRQLLCDPPDEFQCTEPMSVLLWHENDNLLRVFDDFWQYESQGEQAPFMGIVKFAPNERDLSEALVRIRHTGLLLRTLDEVVAALQSLQEPT